MMYICVIKNKETGLKKQDTLKLREKIYGIVKKKLFAAGYDGEIKKDSRGKPYMENCPLCFNISHTGGAAAAAVSEKNVGIDIERVRSVNLKIADKFCKDERKYILSSENQTKAFFEIWTAKEAYLKKEGIGITVPLNSFSVIGRTDIYRYLYEDYIISVCSEIPPQFCDVSHSDIQPV